MKSQQKTYRGEMRVDGFSPKVAGLSVFAEDMSVLVGLLIGSRHPGRRFLLNTAGKPILIH